METNLRELFEKHLTESGYSQESAAKAMGISGSILSSWRKGSYKGDNERVENLIGAYLERERKLAEKAEVKIDFDFVETAVYDKVVTGRDTAEYRRGIRVIIGESGVGKTTALEHLKQQDESMLLFKAYRGVRKNRVLSKLCKEAGFSFRGSFDDLFEELVARLKNSRRLIAIDEAEHLPIDAIDAIRRINDFTGCPVLLVGLPAFYEALRTYQREYAYVFNRVSIPVNVGRISPEDAEKMVATILKSNVDASVWIEASKGIGRDLKEIVLESLRVAFLNGVSPESDKFKKIIAKVTKELGRNTDN